MRSYFGPSIWVPLPQNSNLSRRRRRQGSNAECPRLLCADAWIIVPQRPELVPEADTCLPQLGPLLERRPRVREACLLTPVSLMGVLSQLRPLLVLLWIQVRRPFFAPNLVFDLFRERNGGINVHFSE